MLPQDDSRSAKVTQSAPGSPQGGVVGILFIVTGIILVLTGIVPQIQWWFTEYVQPLDIFRDILRAHPYWAMIVMVILTGMWLRQGRIAGHTWGLATTVAWLATKAYSQVYIVLFAHVGLVEALQVSLGLQFPPTTYSLATLAINVMLLFGAVTLLREGSQLDSMSGTTLVRRGVVIGLLWAAYTIACSLAAEFLVPKPDFIYFNF